MHKSQGTIEAMNDLDSTFDFHSFEHSSFKAYLNNLLSTTPLNDETHIGSSCKSNEAYVLNDISDTVCRSLNFQGKGSWRLEEDTSLKSLYRQYGTQWKHIASFLPGRNGKQCRERFVNHLDGSVSKKKWTSEEDDKLLYLQSQHGNKWSLIASQMSGRSSCGVKNRWKSTCFQSRRKRKSLQRCTDSCRKRKYEFVEEIPVVQSNSPLRIEIGKSGNLHHKWKNVCTNISPLVVKTHYSGQLPLANYENYEI